MVDEMWCDNSNKTIPIDLLDGQSTSDPPDIRQPTVFTGHASAHSLAVPLLISMTIIFILMFV